MRAAGCVLVCGILLGLAGTGDSVAATSPRLRLIIETDAGGDPDDEQSLVRFLLYANEWDIEGIIANRAQARDRENRNPERTGLAIIRRLIEAYSQCHPRLRQHDSRYPSRDQLWQRTVPGYDSTSEAVDVILAAADNRDPRPIWYSDWGTDHGAATNNFKRALDKVWTERGRKDTPDSNAGFACRPMTGSGTTPRRGRLTFKSG